MHATTPYVSINSILYDISTMLPEGEIDKVNMREWAYKGLKGISTNQIYENKVTIIRVIDHKFILPSDLKYIYQIAYKRCSNETFQNELNTIAKSIYQLPTDQVERDIDYNYTNGGYFDGSSTSKQILSQWYRSNTNGWAPMRLSTNVFALSLHCGYSIPECPTCQHEYTISPDMIGTTDLKSGVLLISYLAYPKDDTGNLLIPDDVTLKEAIFHYVMYRYWMTKDILSAGTNNGAASRSKESLQQYNTLSGKAAGRLNMPTLDQLENLRKQSNRLVPRAERYNSFFINLSNPEAIIF